MATYYLPGDQVPLSNATVLQAPADSKLALFTFPSGMFRPDVGGIYSVRSTDYANVTKVTNVVVAEKLTHSLPEQRKGTLVVYVANGTVVATPKHSAAPTVLLMEGGGTIKDVVPSSRNEPPTPRIDGGDLYIQTDGVQAALASLVGMNATQIASAIGPGGTLTTALANAASDPDPSVPNEDPTAAAMINAGWQKAKK